jgi:hypothetical protein
MFMTLNRYFPFAFIYFFVNSLALPLGLTYTAMLAPLFYVWILLTRKKEVLFPFIMILLPFVVIHIMIVGVEMKSYLLSLGNLMLVYIFCQAVYTFLKVCDNPEKIFRRLLILNFILCLIAIPIYFTPYFNWLWLEQSISAGLISVRRLRLFTYEPSYYAMLFTPIFFFYLLQYFSRLNTISNGWLFLMLFVPYVLSFSVGVIGAALVAGIITWLVYFVRLTRKRRILNAIVYTGAFFGSSIVILVLFFRHNPLFSRLGNIFSGRDTSGKGRTIDAFILANKILETGNEFWGIGIGQIKIVGENIIRSYYMYNPGFAVAIPNAVAETWAMFGSVGVSLRILIEVFLFFYTRVWSNYYRLLLFLFIFVYQFTGSFITNTTEYVIWVMAFTNVFKEFDVVPVKDDSRDLV